MKNIIALLSRYYLFLYFLSRFFYKRRIFILSKIIDKINLIFFRFWFPGSIKSGRGLILGYSGIGIVIHSNTIIGDFVRIGQNVTIGKNLNETKVPEIGDNVYVGANSVIFGEITIGNNVVIGAGSIVNRSIPDNEVWAGNPARLIKKVKNRS